MRGKQPVCSEIKAVKNTSKDLLKLQNFLHSLSNSLLEGKSKHSSFFLSPALYETWLFIYIYVAPATKTSS